MASRTRKRTIYFDVESTYATDPDATGAGYTHIPALTLGDLSNNKESLDTDYRTGRNFPTAPIAGRDGWEFTMDVPLIGLSTAAGDGGSPPADDWFDAILTHIFGTQNQHNGEGLAAASGTSITADADTFDAQDLVPIYELDANTIDRSEWVLVTVDAGGGSYTVAPSLSGTYTTAAVAYGVNAYDFTQVPGGNTLAFVYQEDDVDYTLLGGRCSAASITAEVGQIARMSLTFRGDNRTQETKGSLPTVTEQTFTPIKMLRSCFSFNGTNYETRVVNVDFGLNAQEEGSTKGAEGRSNDEVIDATPTISVEPLRTDAILELQRQATKGRVMAQFGGGVLTGGTLLNTCAFHMEEAVAPDAGVQDENGRLRNAITFRVADKVEFTSGVAARAVQFARA